MKREGLAPGVEDGGEAELSAEVLRVASKGLDRLARREEEQIVEDPRSGEGQRAQLVRQREDDMEVRDGEQIGTARREPVISHDLDPTPRARLVQAPAPRGGPEMAYREIAMWEIWEVLRRVHRGEGQRAIQRVTGHGR